MTSKTIYRQHKTHERKPMTSQRSLTGMALLFLLALLPACGDHDGGSGTARVTAVIGTAGGTLTGPDGVQVEVPPGALDQPTEIGIARSAVGAPEVPDAYPVAGNVYELTPHDVLFNLPVTVRAPVPSGASGTTVFMASLGEDWNLKDAVVANGVAEWERNSFSHMYMGLMCFIPVSMENDPYWCVQSWSYARITTTPAQALTLTSVPHVIDGDAGSYRVDQAATLHLKSHPSVAGNCRNVAVKFFRSRFNESTQAWSPRQLLSTQRPALTVVGSRLDGTATFDLPFTYLDNGKNHFSMVVSYDCPGVLRAYSTVVGYDYANYRSHKLGDGMLVVGNITQPTVFYAVGGAVSGLTGSGLVLQNNGGDNLAVTADGAFSFGGAVAAGANYSVSVQTQPSGQSCSVQNGSGTANADVTNVAVSCGALALGVSPANPTAVGCSVDTVTFTASGGTAPYTWTTSEGGSTNLTVTSATQAQWRDGSDNFCGASGTVTISVTDAVGATASATMTVQDGL
jgi:hypothetical protein